MRHNFRHGPSPRPSWPHCALGADSADPVGCHGIEVPGFGACLAHLASADRAAYLAALRPGADLDVRGTPLSSPLLDDLLGALRDPAADDHPVLGTSKFDHAHFGGTAKFDGVDFRGDVRFTDAVFSGDAWFERANFFGSARFSRTRFERDAQFGHASFHDAARFHETVFRGGTGFEGAGFNHDALFARTAFTGNADFHGVRFGSTVRFVHTSFGGRASFAEASFSADASFPAVRFSGTAGFDRARYTASADFGGSVFEGDATFQEVVFGSAAGFSEAAFSGDAAFEKAVFHGTAAFGRAQFGKTAGFEKARFEATADFSSVRCLGDASFIAARFQDMQTFGPVTCTGRLDLGQAAFTAPVTVQAGAAELSCVGTRFEGPATLRVRFAAVDLSEAVLTQPVLLTSTGDAQLEPGEALLAFGREATASVVSIRRVDAALLMLNDVDLSRCVFFGAHHLDQLRLTGECDFAGPPPGLRRGRPVPVRWTARQVLAEEHHWRSLPLHRRAARQGWMHSPRRAGPGPAPVPGPATLAMLYRQLRKAFEDGKDEPGAADFYYGEMEMRRHDRHRTQPTERGLLHAYWLLSGYGLRASRALAWLLGAMTATVFALMLWGLPSAEAQPLITGSRAEKALRVVLNSVVFRSSGQGLSTAGVYIEMTSRLLEPVLLALAFLAVRGRVKR